MRNANFVVFRKCLSGVFDAINRNSIESSLYPIKNMNKLEDELLSSTIAHFDYSDHIHAYHFTLIPAVPFTEEAVYFFLMRSAKTGERAHLLIEQYHEKDGDRFTIEIEYDVAKHLPFVTEMLDDSGMLENERLDPHRVMSQNEFRGMLSEFSIPDKITWIDVE